MIVLLHGTDAKIVRDSVRKVIPSVSHTLIVSENQQELDEILEARWAELHIIVWLDDASTENVPSVLQVCRTFSMTEKFREAGIPCTQVLTRHSIENLLCILLY